MRNLEFGMIKLVENARPGAYQTQRRMMSELRGVAKDIYAAGFVHLQDPRDIKGRHLNAVIEGWKARLAPSTVKTKMSTLRWLAREIGKPGLLPKKNAPLGIAPRTRRANDEGRAYVLTEEDYRRLPEDVRLQVRLCAAFGLRMEEGMKFRPRQAVKGDRIELQKSWTKGGRPRSVPVLTEEQRAVLKEAKAFARTTPQGSLIPTKTYEEARNRFRNATYRVGLASHDFRHAYAQRRYLELTGRPAPMAGGPSVLDACPAGSEARRIDDEARATIARELGHDRTEVSRDYLGW